MLISPLFRGHFLPPGLPRLNWQHPLAPLLYGALVRVGSTLYDLTGRLARPTASGGTPGVAITRAGPVVDFNASYLTFADPTPSNAALSVVALAVRTVTPNTSTENNKIAPLLSTTLETNTGWWCNLGNAYASVNRIYYGNLLAGFNQGMVGFYVNGASYASGSDVVTNGHPLGIAFSMSVANASGNGLWIGRYPGPSYQMLGGGPALALFFRVLLPDGILRDLSLNPSQMLLWPEDEVFGSGTASLPALDAIINAGTLSLGTASLTARWQPHGGVRIRTRRRAYRDVPAELVPVVSLAETFEEAEVNRAVLVALRRMRDLGEQASIARRMALVERLQAEIVAAMERADEADDEDALVALL